MSSPFVRVLGVALVVSACEKQPIVHGNPPPPPDPVPTPEEPVVLRNPPAPLPTWDEVKSTHPEGATNPPSPVLIVSRAPLRCFKGWMGGMQPWPADVRDAGGRVVATPEEAGANATEIVCPDGEPYKLIAAWDALPAKAPL